MMMYDVFYYDENGNKLNDWDSCTYLDRAQKACQNHNNYAFCHPSGDPHGTSWYAWINPEGSFIDGFPFDPPIESQDPLNTMTESQLTEHLADAALYAYAWSLDWREAAEAAKECAEDYKIVPRMEVIHQCVNLAKARWNAGERVSEF